MNNLYLDKISINLNSENGKIKEYFEKIRKDNELDKDKRSDNDISKIAPDEFKKYSETFSPYPFFLYAYKNGASDIQFLAMKDTPTEVRFKIDGTWSTEFYFHRDNHILYINALKNWLVKGSGNVSNENQKIPQDGKGIFYIINEKKQLEKTIQLRFASAPQHYTDSNGNILETATVRLLGGSKMIKLEDSGFLNFDIDKINSLAKIKKGLILISGPTGSGKSTTLFNYIHNINNGTKNIITFENPVEFDVPGIVQLDVKPIEDITDNDEITFNFERGKNYAMRAAPDVALVGEIRNYTTALSGVQLATTGHITLGTLHTNSTINTISRYIGFKDKKGNGISKEDLIPLLKYVSAQMLAPRLCNHCKIKVKDINENTGIELFDFQYREMKKEINYLRTMVKKEFLKPNIKLLLPTLDEKAVDLLIDNSYVPNLHGCKHCIESNNEKINPRSGRKGMVLLNESLVFDEYLLNLLKDGGNEIKEKEIIEKLTNERPLLQKSNEHAITDKKQFFFTLFQDALLKSLLPINNLKAIMNTNESNLLSILDAKEYGDPKL